MDSQPLSKYFGTVVSFTIDGETKEGAIIDHYFDLRKIEVPGEDGTPEYYNIHKDRIRCVKVEV